MEDDTETLTAVSLLNYIFAMSIPFCFLIHRIRLIEITFLKLFLIIIIMFIELMGHIKIIIIIINVFSLLHATLKIKGV